MSASCLNCRTPLQGSYCHQCGQKSSTHRITFAKFLQHDLIHGIFHLDKGVIFTIKSLLYNPGYAAKSFIQGKRVMHYNIFALFIIIIALKTLIDLQISPDDVFYSFEKNKQQSDKILNTTIHHYYKLFYLLIIPLLSVFSFILLKRLHFNFTEHLVFNAFLLAGSFFYALLFSAFEYLTGLWVSYYGMYLIPVYLMLGYYQGTAGVYKFFGYLWRSATIVILFALSLLLLLSLVILVFYNGVFEGQIGLT